jgi:integrase
MARISMSIIKNEHGVFHVRKKVPKRLEEATATVMGQSKDRVSWLQRSLKTKELRQAKRLAPPILMEFDRILAEAEALTAERPLRSSLERREIERIAEFFYAHELAADEERRRNGDSEALFQDVARQLEEAGINHNSPYAIGPVPEFGLSAREMDKINQEIDICLGGAQQALATGNISSFTWEIDELLKLFRINLDRNSASYRELAAEVLKAFIRALEAIQRRHKGEIVETPIVPEVHGEQPSNGETLRAAYEGWKKTRRRPENTLREFSYAIDRFIELHGDMLIAKITRGHVRQFREALQMIPVRRSGDLRAATLPALRDWSNAHPEAKRVSAATVNKVLGSVQAITKWARDNGVIPDDVHWADPFSNMRLQEEKPDREPWQINELKVLFSSPVFTQGLRPKAGRGEAACWLPLLAMFTGARLGELAPLTVTDVTTDEPTGIATIRVTEDLEQGRRLKNVGSRRIVPIHPELVRLGFMHFVEQVRDGSGGRARLFPLLTPGPKGAFGEAWSKWFGRYIRSLGITNRASVFHSFRHGFKDALRAAEVSEDVNDALTGHAGGGVGRSYGAKEVVKRFGLRVLADAVAKVAYPNLDLSHLHKPRTPGPGGENACVQFGHERSHPTAPKS